ncbi:hypothetical protein JMJ77_0012329, partial [Colletotrichum scovillei]
RWLSKELQHHRRWLLVPLPKDYQNFPGPPPTFIFIISKFGITKRGSPHSPSFKPPVLSQSGLACPRAPMGAG